MQTLIEGTKAYQLMKNEGKGEGFSHAYLLVFPDARFLPVALKCFAKLLFSCEKQDTPAKKRVAERIDGESFVDCVFFPEKGKKLMVEDAENILEESTLAPVEGEKKVFVLSDFADANTQTQNKLLKLLEEPPQGVVFLLGATSAFPVLTTVLSRTKVLEIPPFTEREVEDYLVRTYGDKYTREELALCATTAGGKVGDACNLLEGGTMQTLLGGAFQLLLAPSYKLPLVIKELGELPQKRELLSLLRLIFRDALLLKTGGRKNRLLLSAEQARVQNIANEYSLEGLIYAQEAITKAEKQVKFNAIFSQCLELCMADILRRK